MSGKIEQLRKQIDALDSKILDLLNERAKIAIKVGEEKSKNSMAIHSPDRERLLYERLYSHNKGPLPNETIKNIYREIISGSLSLEKPLKVAYLGPQGTFSHIAVLRQFGSSVVSIPKESIDGVFKEAEKGNSDYALVPVENSIEGMVSITLDLLIDCQLTIMDEILLPINLNLVSKYKTTKNIKKIFSHYQPAAQCSRWLETNMKGIEIVDTISSSMAAEYASKEKESAAISSEYAASLYGLNILARRIEDNTENTTRFLVLGKGKREKTGSDKTSLLISLKDAPGALFNVLKPFSDKNINLTKIESRPLKKRAWEYIFFIDIDGHISDKNIQDTLINLEKELPFLKILGSYPKGKKLI